jgi:hypothetical protein
MASTISLFYCGGFHHLATFKNITQGKPPLCGYFCADLGILACEINGLTRDAFQLF